MNISSYPERELLKIASGFKKHLKDKFPAMKGDSSGMGNDFIYKFKALFYEIQAHPWEPEAENLTAKYKLDLDALIEQLRNFLLIFRFYLQKAFPYDSELCESFGYVQVEKVTHDYAELRLFLERTLNLISEKRTFLRTANCPESTLEEIISFSNQITEVHDEMLKYSQKQELQNRTYQNNMKELFKLMEIVHEAASKNLQDDPESLRHLTFPSKEYIH
ncbi:MAG: hypothetical protein WCJ95_08900 [Mariniphaga sp.]